LDDEIANEILPEFVYHLITTHLVDKEFIEDGHIYEVEKQFLHSPSSSLGSFITVHPCDLSTNPVWAL
jgi:hypothetical protein